MTAGNGHPTDIGVDPTSSLRFSRVYAVEEAADCNEALVRWTFLSVVRRVASQSNSGRLPEPSDCHKCPFSRYQTDRNVRPTDLGADPTSSLRPGFMAAVSCGKTIWLRHPDHETRSRKRPEACDKQMNPKKKFGHLVVGGTPLGFETAWACHPACASRHRALAWNHHAVPDIVIRVIPGARPGQSVTDDQPCSPT